MIQRYYPDIESDGGWESCDAYPRMVKSEHGDWVSFDDYQALEARLAEVRQLLAETLEASRQLGRDRDVAEMRYRTLGGDDAARDRDGDWEIETP